MIFRLTFIALALFLAGCSYLPTGAQNGEQTETSEASQPNAKELAELERKHNTDLSAGLFPQPTTAESLSALKVKKEETLIERALNDFTWPNYSDHEDVNYWANRYLKDGDQFDAILVRAEPFLFHILDQLEQAGLPAELAFLPFVETGFRPEVASWKGAAGLWQFMPATGRYFDLDQDWWVDERRSIDNSTDAAIRYLSYLYNYFDDDWFMALAAYNTGEGNLRKAMRASPENADYWDLKLNTETATYVPKLLAVIQILKEADNLEVDLPNWPNQPYFETYQSDRQLDLEVVANHLEIDKQQIFAINAHYPQAITPPNQKARILLPMGMAENLSQIVESLPEVTGPAWAHYKVRSGDNLSLIADRMNVSLRAVMQANQLSSNLIHPGDDLLIPSPNRVQSDPVITGSVVMVRPGDSIGLIARRYGVGVNALLAANNLAESDYIFPGQTLKLSIQTEGDSRLTHEVRNGDSLYDIAALYGVRLAELKRWNSLGNSNLIRPGDQLTVWQAID